MLLVGKGTRGSYLVNIRNVLLEPSRQAFRGTGAENCIQRASLAGLILFLSRSDLRYIRHKCTYKVKKKTIKTQKAKTLIGSEWMADGLHPVLNMTKAWLTICDVTTSMRHSSQRVTCERVHRMCACLIYKCDGEVNRGCEEFISYIFGTLA